MRHAPASYLLLTLILIVLVGWACSSSGFGGKLMPATQISWPPGAEDTRVEVLFSYEGASRPGGEQGFFSKLTRPKSDAK